MGIDEWMDGMDGMNGRTSLMKLPAETGDIAVS